jgi:hypothetical protein
MDILIPVIENDPEDFGRIKDELTPEHLWIEATGPLDWLRRDRIRPRLMQENSVFKGNYADARAALAEALTLGAPLLLLDLGLSGADEDAVKELGDGITDEADMERLWQGRDLERVGGLWILRELQRLRGLGFAVPAVAIGTNFPRFTTPTLPWTTFLLKHGAAWVYPKPFSDYVARKLLYSLVILLAGGAAQGIQTRLAGHYQRLRGVPESQFWELAQLEVFDLLDRALTRDEVSNQRDRAKALGMAYNTYRSWVQKIEDRKE